MRILQVIPYFVPAYSYGGPVKVCFDISKELVNRGHEVTVVTTDTLDANNRIAKKEEIIDGIHVIRFRNISNRMAKSYNAYLPVGFYRWAKNNIHSFDVVHCHDLYTLQNIIVSYFCKKNKVPFIIQPHGTLSPISRNARFKWLKGTFINTSQVLRNAKHIIVLTKREKNNVIAISKEFENRIRIIPNGIKKEEFEGVSKIDLHKKYGFPREHKLIGFIGRIQYIKGIDLALEILAKLKDHISFSYLMIGPDEGEKDSLEKKIIELGLQEQVQFTGILTGKEKLETMKSCDVFLFTSRSEGLPVTILEVAAMGIPQIISSNCNVPEVEKMGAGHVLDLEDQEGFIEKLVEILRKDDLRKTLGGNAVKMVEKHFELSLVCDRVEQMIN